MNNGHKYKANIQKKFHFMKEITVRQDTDTQVHKSTHIQTCNTQAYMNMAS